MNHPENNYLKLILSVIVIWLLADFIYCFYQIEKRLPALEKRRNMEETIKLEEQKLLLFKEFQIDSYTNEEIESPAN